MSFNFRSLSKRPPLKQGGGGLGKRAIVIMAWLGTGLACRPVAAAPLQTESELRDECSGPNSESGMYDCLAARAKASALELRQAEIAMRVVLPKVDEWPRFVAEAKLKFVRSSREFARYRAAQCAFNAALVGAAAGNAHEIMRLACVTELNARRAEQLRQSAGSIADR
jgi:uncharacterized protein YecT (DUF1311 family)